MPEKIGFLFPGQGAQYVGMGKDLFEEFPSPKKIYRQADSILGYSISEICFEGPEDKLTRTCFAQPAIYVTSMAALTILKEKFSDLIPQFVAGLSLGEFTALAASGAFSFEDGLKLVRKRAEAMEAAALKKSGTMASIMGLSKEDCESVAKEAGCEVANLNTPDQTVLSGSVETIDKACTLVEARGAKQAMKLKVGGAFHSSLMNDAKIDLRNALQEIKIQQPLCSFIPNASAQIVSDPNEIRNLLAQQLTNPVRWVETMARAVELGVDFFIEIGPGKVLSGLARKCQPKFTVEACGKSADFSKLETLFAAK